MKFAEIQSTLETYFQSQWTATPLAFENVIFDSSAEKEFVRFSLQYGQSVLRAIGGVCYRQIGVAFVQIFIRPSIGVDRINKLADLASNILTNVQVPLSGKFIQLNMPSLSSRSAERDGWVMATLSVPFYFDSENV